MFSEQVLLSFEQVFLTFFLNCCLLAVFFSAVFLTAVFSSIFFKRGGQPGIQDLSRLEAITIRLEAIAIRLQAIAIRLEASASRLAIAIRLEAIAIGLQAMAIRLEAIASRLEGPWLLGWRSLLLGFKICLSLRTKLLWR